MKNLPGLQELQSISYGDPAIKIAILDGPVDLTHTCFHTASGKLVSWNNGNVKPSSAIGARRALRHGTAVASLIFGKPESQVQGIAPGCSGIIIPIYSDEANGKFTSSTQVGLAKAILLAVENGANIINISGGEFSRSGEPDFFLKQAIKACADAGVLIVAAAGNDGCNCLHVPASDQQVLAVGSCDENGVPTPETNFGDAYKSNGILAPGKSQLAALAGGGSFFTNGATSYATPIVSGIVGLLMSIQIKNGIKPDAYVIKSILEKHVLPCSDNSEIVCQRFLRGKLNLSGILPILLKNAGILASSSEPLKADRFPCVVDAEIDLSDLLNETHLIVPTSSITQPSGEIDPSDCGCSGNKDQASIVYALGTIGYDFGSESHRDSFAQSIGDNPHDAKALLAYLKKNPQDAEELIWTLNIDSTPIYAITPVGAHSQTAYIRIRQFMEEQLKGTIQRISVPGISKGSISLLNGQKVAHLIPRQRGMYSWMTATLVKTTNRRTTETVATLAEQVTNFLNRIHYKLRNVGITSQERALNYAATNTYQVSAVFASALDEHLELDEISATKSPLGKPGADCYDVILTFFNPTERLTQARKEYRLTIDVSDVIPITVGEIRSWSFHKFF